MQNAIMRKPSILKSFDSYCHSYMAYILIEVKHLGSSEIKVIPLGFGKSYKTSYNINRKIFLREKEFPFFVFKNSFHFGMVICQELRLTMNNYL